MDFQVRRIQVWTGEVPDRPGVAAAKLEVLAHAGIDLEFVFTRPHPRKPDIGMIFLAPISGPEQIQAARSVELAPALDVAMLCVTGENRAGVGYEIMSRLAIAGVNLRGLSVSAVGHQFAAYLAFDSADDATMALQVLTH